MKNSDMQNKQVYEKALNDAWAKYAEVFELKSHEPNEAFKHVFAHAYRLGMETAKKQPLAERLTEEEKKKIRNEYDSYRHRWFDAQSKSAAYSYLMNVSALESIFGSDFFNESKEESNG